ncbi:MAG: winged helix-turn-helix domain-containing protein [Peptococcaceae bacterium]|nr:winged helix-turn-helix domain-containing protein [Peptococcaceae bacterium]
MGGIRKEREDFIPESGPVNRNQRVLTKEAIMSLLRKGRHTPREIAEHFGLSVNVVSELIDELVRAGRVRREAGKRPLVRLSDHSEKSLGEK